MDWTARLDRRVLVKLGQRALLALQVLVTWVPQELQGSQSWAQQGLLASMGKWARLALLELKATLVRQVLLELVKWARLGLLDCQALVK
jgi:hypothetical protein